MKQYESSRITLFYNKISIIFREGSKNGKEVKTLYFCLHFFERRNSLRKREDDESLKDNGSILKNNNKNKTVNEKKFKITEVNMEAAQAIKR